MKTKLQLVAALLISMTVSSQDITTGLAFHLNGDETATGASNDLISVGPNQGTITGTLSNVEGADGSPSGALKFDGSSYIDFNTSDFSDIPVGAVSTEGRTYSVWVNRVDTGNGDILTYGAGNNREHFHLHYKDELIKVDHWNAKFEYSIDAFVAGAWDHVLFTLTASVDGNSVDAKLYFNGVFMGDINYGNNDINTIADSVLRIGGRNISTGDRITASIDDLRIYNRALTEADAIALFQANGGVLSSTKINSNEFKIYPTVTSDFVNISSIADLKDLKIINISGVTVKEIKDNTAKINVSDLASGLYFIVGTSNTGNFTSKFIKK